VYECSIPNLKSVSVKDCMLQACVKVKREENLTCLSSNDNIFLAKLSLVTQSVKIIIA